MAVDIVELQILLKICGRGLGRSDAITRRRRMPRVGTIANYWKALPTRWREPPTHGPTWRVLLADDCQAADQFPGNIRWICRWVWDRMCGRVEPAAPDAPVSKRSSRIRKSTRAWETGGTGGSLAQRP